VTGGKVEQIDEALHLQGVRAKVRTIHWPAGHSFLITEAGFRIRIRVGYASLDMYPKCFRTSVIKKVKIKK
jgi:hypothetical protein